MRGKNKFRSVAPLALLAVAGLIPMSAAQDLPATACDLLAHEERTELEDAQLAVTLARENFAAYEQIMVLIEGLWEADAIERMGYLQAKYDRDAARLALEQADLLLTRQSALVEQLRLVCNAGGSEAERRERAQAARKLYLRYRTADCDALSKAAEVAATNLEFNRELLQNMLNLRAADVATKPDVILAELAVKREEASRADAARRAKACREALPAGAASPAEPSPSDSGQGD